MAKTKRPPQTRKKLGGSRVEGGHRADKIAAVSDLGTRFAGATAVIVSEYRGLTVHELAELRTNLREAGADYKIYKNTLATIAAREAGFEELVPHLTGPTAFTFAAGDPVLAAKKLSDFAKKVPALVLKGGVLDRKVLSTAEVNALGSLESREVMLAKVAGLFLSPIQRFANLMAAPLNQLGAVLVQLRDKLPGEAAPAAPTPEPAAPEVVAEAPAEAEAVAVTEPVVAEPAEAAAEEPAPAVEPTETSTDTTEA